MENIFLELTIILTSAGVIAYLARFLKQPTIIAYILTGLVISLPGIYNIHHREIWHSLAEIGITLLLFMVGLDLDLSQLKRIGKAAIIAGIGQVLFTMLIGFGIIKMLGVDNMAAWYIAIALTFSSTIIVVKLLSEKKDLQSLYGKLAIGIFLIQDVAAIFILIFLAGLTGSADNPISQFGISGQIILTLTKAFLAGTVVVWLTKYVFPKLISSIEKSDELILLFALVWSLGLASLFNLPQIGFSPAIGGFVAGLALANTGVHHQISGRIKSLRDFFIIIFFIVLGSELVLSGIGAAIVPALILSAFVLIGNPIIVMIILGLMGYKPRVSFMAGVTVAQISEFSLILIALGLAKNHVSEIHVTIVTLVGIITIGVSSLAITYSEKLYKFFHPILWIFDFHKASTNQILLENPPKNHILIIGVHRLGSHILGSLDKNQPTVLIDFNPDIAHYYKREGYNSICGDITDPSIQELVNIQHSKLIISTLPELQDNLGLLETSKKSKKRIQTIVAATDELDANVLYEAGADYVLLPHFIGGLHLAEIIHKNHNLSSLKKLKKQHLHSLKKLTHFH